MVCLEKGKQLWRYWVTWPSVVMGVAIKSDGNLIDGTTPETRNILSGNAEGIEIRNGSYNSTTKRKLMYNCHACMYKIIGR